MSDWTHPIWPALLGPTLRRASAVAVGSAGAGVLLYLRQRERERHLLPRGPGDVGSPPEAGARAMKKKAMKRRIRHLEQRLYQELPQLQLENDLLRYSKTGSVSSWVTEALGGHHPGPSIEYVTRPENIARGGYPGYYPDPQVPDQEC